MEKAKTHREKENVDEILQCNCGHCHLGEKETSVQTQQSKSFFVKNLSYFIRLILSVAILIVVSIISISEKVEIVLCSVSAILVGYPVLVSAVKNLFKGEFFDELFLTTIAVASAFIIGEHFEGVLIYILFSIGSFLEELATDQTKKKIKSIKKIKSVTVHLYGKDGVIDVEPTLVKIGSLIEVKKGERIPIDGVLFFGEAVIDGKAITGESNYVTVKQGEEVVSGAINVGNPLIMKTTKLYSDSTAEKIVQIVDSALAKKSKTQKFITLFAKIYTPIIIVVAILVGVLPPLFDGYNFTKWVYKAMTFLVISCPCALVISVPMAYFVSIGALAKLGILVKGSVYLESISKAKTCLFDKTGTLTEGEFTVTEIKVEKSYEKNYVKQLAVSLESASNHPLSKAIIKAFDGVKAKPIFDVKEYSGYGIAGIIDGKNVKIGNAKFVNFNDNEKFSVLYVQEDGKVIAKILLEDRIKSNCKDCISSLKRLGITYTGMISGDKINVCEKVVRQAGLDDYYGELLPNEKLSVLEEIKVKHKGKVIYVGDGINDAPALVSSDVGISMGKMGSDVAVECSDVIIINDDLSKLPKLVNQSKAVQKTVLQNIFGALSIKFIFMILSLLTTLPVWLAVFSDVGTMLLAILNSLKVGRVKSN